MIKINLLPGENKEALSKLSLINVKLVVIFGILVYSVEPLIDIAYEADIDNYLKQEKVNKGKIRKLKQQLRGYESVKKQVQDLNAREENLASKIRIVKGIVEKRQNPFKILKYIAENTPEDVWITSLEITDKELKMLGYSKSWNIGSFIENLKNSIFFSGNINYSKPKGMKTKIDDSRVESFEIKTTIVSFK